MFNNCISEQIPWFSLNGLICKCKVIDVYDADTVTIILSFNEKLYKVKCRLLGIDSAEKRTTNNDEKKVALEATEWLSGLINGTEIWVKCGNWGKYGGRMLGTLYTEHKHIEINESINQKIIDKGYAYKYDGKKKKTFEEWFKPLNI